MKTPQSKFLFIVLFFISIIIIYVVFDKVFNSKIDRSSYVSLLNWEAFLNENKLEIEIKNKLETWDKIKTIWQSSLAVIKWGDWSITRLWWDSSLVIKEANIDKKLLNIKIDFELEKWKTWSNVVSFMWNDSYFSQEFADTTAAVRWTIFEVNLEKDYVYTHSHEIKLTKKDWETKTISENKPFIISQFSFTSLVEFIKNFKDDSFMKLNINLDKEFYNDLVKNIWDLSKFGSDKISDISKLSPEDKKKLYNKILSQYQNLWFVNPDSKELYNKKIEIKKSLLELADDSEKQKILVESLYDFKALAKNKQFEELKNLSIILAENKDALFNSNIRWENYIDKSFIDKLNDLDIAEGLKKEFEKNFNEIKTNLNLENIDPLIDSAKKSIQWIKDSFKDSFKN